MKTIKEKYEMFIKFDKITLAEYITDVLLQSINDNTFDYKSRYSCGDFHLTINGQELNFEIQEGEWVLVNENSNSDLTFNIAGLPLCWGSCSIEYKYIHTLGYSFSTNDRIHIYKNIDIPELVELLRKICDFSNTLPQNHIIECYMDKLKYS